jgi:hypothetical protein
MYKFHIKNRKVDKELQTQAINAMKTRKRDWKESFIQRRSQHGTKNKKKVPI